MPLQIQTFTGLVGRYEDTNWIFIGISIEGMLEHFSLILRRCSRVNSDSLRCAVGMSDGSPKTTLDITPGIFPLSEDNEFATVPWVSFSIRAGQYALTLMTVDPFEQLPDSCIVNVAVLVGKRDQFVECCELSAKSALQLGFCKRGHGGGFKGRIYLLEQIRLICVGAGVV